MCNPLRSTRRWFSAALFAPLVARVSRKRPPTVAEVVQACFKARSDLRAVSNTFNKDLGVSTTADHRLDMLIGYYPPLGRTKPTV
jgi:hypothetical protein